MQQRMVKGIIGQHQTQSPNNKRTQKTDKLLHSVKIDYQKTVEEKLRSNKVKLARRHDDDTENHSFYSDHDNEITDSCLDFSKNRVEMEVGRKK